jgi:TnpA family transposase
MSQFTAGQSVATARILFLVIRAVLESVMQESEDAVNKITVSLDNMSQLSQEQRKKLSDAIEGFYHGTQSEEFKKSLNDAATAIMDAASTGDFKTVDAIADSSTYQDQKNRTKILHDNLQEVMESSDSLQDTIMPLLISLQFQDKLKQQLVGVGRALELFMARDTVVVDGTINFDDFWEKVQKGFNVVETRNTVLRIVKEYLASQKAA